MKELLQGIAQKLYGCFGDGYEIYTDDVKQGLQEPCFFIAFLEPSWQRLPGRRWRLQNMWDITYFPLREESTQEVLETAQRLMVEMEFITLPNGDLVHGIDMRWQESDGVLHFFVSYPMTFREDSQLQAMEELQVEAATKEEKGGR